MFLPSPPSAVMASRRLASPKIRMAAAARPAGPSGIILPGTLPLDGDRAFLRLRARHAPLLRRRPRFGTGALTLKSARFSLRPGHFLHPLLRQYGSSLYGRSFRSRYLLPEARLLICTDRRRSIAVSD